MEKVHKLFRMEIPTQDILITENGMEKDYFKDIMEKCMKGNLRTINLTEKVNICGLMEIFMRVNLSMDNTKPVK